MSDAMEYDSTEAFTLMYHSTSQLTYSHQIPKCDAELCSLLCSRWSLITVCDIELCCSLRSHWCKITTCDDLWQSVLCLMLHRTRDNIQHNSVTSSDVA